MSGKEVPRAGVVEAARGGRSTNAQGAQALRLSVRQFQGHSISEHGGAKRVRHLTIEPILAWLRPEKWYALLDLRFRWDLEADKLAPTARRAVGRKFGENDRWQVEVYGEPALNNFARQSRLGYRVGLDLDRYLD